MNKSTTIQEIRSIIKDITVTQQETNQQIEKLSKETDKLFATQKETSEQMKQRTAERDKEMKQRSAKRDKEMKQRSAERDKEMKQRTAERDKEMKELRASQQEAWEQIKATSKKLSKYIGESGNRWGKLGENLVKGALAQRLKERGIEIERVMTNLKKRDAEFDIVAVNGREIVVLEVKASLDPSDIDDFEENITKFKKLWPEFKEKIVYGAMAFLIKANKQADNIAKKRGFFLISATGDVIIENKKNFKPKVFN